MVSDEGTNQKFSKKHKNPPMQRGKRGLKKPKIGKGNSTISTIYYPSDLFRRK